MNKEPTFPCPICHAPILARHVDLPAGYIARIYAEPLTGDDEIISFHKHQIGDVEIAMMH